MKNNTSPSSTCSDNSCTTGSCGGPGLCPGIALFISYIVGGGLAMLTGIPWLGWAVGVPLVRLCIRLRQWEMAAESCHKHGDDGSGLHDFPSLDREGIAIPSLYQTRDGRKPWKFSGNSLTAFQQRNPRTRNRKFNRLVAGSGSRSPR